MAAGSRYPVSGRRFIPPDPRDLGPHAGVDKAASHRGGQPLPGGAFRAVNPRARRAFGPGRGKSAQGLMGTFCVWVTDVAIGGQPFWRGLRRRTAPAGPPANPPLPKPSLFLYGPRHL